MGTIRSRDYEIASNRCHREFRLHQQEDPKHCTCRACPERDGRGQLSTGPHGLMCELMAHPESDADRRLHARVQLDRTARRQANGLSDPGGIGSRDDSTRTRAILWDSGKVSSAAVHRYRIRRQTPAERRDVLLEGADLDLRRRAGPLLAGAGHSAPASLAVPTKRRDIPWPRR